MFPSTVPIGELATHLTDPLHLNRQLGRVHTHGQGQHGFLQNVIFCRIGQARLFMPIAAVHRCPARGFARLAGNLLIAEYSHTADDEHENQCQQQRIDNGTLDQQSSTAPQG